MGYGGDNAGGVSLRRVHHYIGFATAPFGTVPSQIVVRCAIRHFATMPGQHVLSSCSVPRWQYRRALEARSSMRQQVNLPDVRGDYISQQRGGLVSLTYQPQGSPLDCSVLDVHSWLSPPTLRSETGCQGPTRSLRHRFLAYGPS
jgi:hypothetical protein